jgi:hypothetical protein
MKPAAAAKSCSDYRGVGHPRGDPLQMEAGTTPWRGEWVSTGGGHHVNLLNGHRYQGANPILLCLGIHLRGSGLPYWCGFAEARAQGIFPRKGSQGVRILRPQVNRVAAGMEGSSIPDTSDPGATTSSPPADGTPAERTWVSFRKLATQLEHGRV